MLDFAFVKDLVAALLVPDEIFLRVCEKDKLPCTPLSPTPWPCTNGSASSILRYQMSGPDFW